MVEAFAYYKEEKAYDVELDDYSQKTKISHVFVYENEEKIRQDKRREEKRREELRKFWEKQYQSRGDEIRSILNPKRVEEEYVFDDDSTQF